MPFHPGGFRPHTHVSDAHGGSILYPGTVGVKTSLEVAGRFILDQGVWDVPARILINLTGSQTDLAPGGFTKWQTTWWQPNTDPSVLILHGIETSGFFTALESPRIYIINRCGAGSGSIIRLVEESSTELTAANRMDFGGSGGIVLYPTESIELHYVQNSISGDRWRPIHQGNDRMLAVFLS